MFEAAEVGRKISKEEFAAALPRMRERLLAAQFALREAKFPVIVIVAGADGAGKGDVVNRLHEWLDPRGLDVHALGRPSDEEEERPYFWRFWRRFPARGRIGILLGSWYTDPILERAYGKLKKGRFHRRVDRIAFLEQMLAADGVLIVKFWLHLSARAQIKKLEALENDPRTRWRVTATDWKHVRLYDKLVAISEGAIRRTDSGHARWWLIEAEDAHYRDLMVGETLLAAMEERGKNGRPVPSGPPSVIPFPSSPLQASTSVLDRVDLTASLSAPKYERRLSRYQGELGRRVKAAYDRSVSTVLVFEGWDAAGKGGAIRRLASAIDARNVRVLRIGAPTDEERAHHYLWRFWRHLPRAGYLTIFDRSWYGRVLVERVEGFAAEEEWRRAYLEINDFEEQLVEHGIVLVKFWIHISKDEQLRRFEERQRLPYKRHKITEEDWRNREKWDAYEAAVNEMVARTSTRAAPWTILAGESKKFARVQALKTVVKRLKRKL